MIEYRASLSCPRYRAGEDGSVIGPSGRLLNPYVGNHGYLRFSAHCVGGRHTASVHILVCEAFHGRKPDGKEASHLDGNQLNCCAGNLQWKTSTENNEDRRLHGTMVVGEDSNLAKLTENEVREIRLAYRQFGAPTGGLALLYGVTIDNVRMILQRKTWRHVL